MARSRCPKRKRKSSALPPPVFPLLVSAPILHNKPEEEPPATAPDPQANKDPIDTILYDRINTVAPFHGASTDYAKLNGICQRLAVSEYQYYPIEGQAALVGADPRLTSRSEVHRIGGISWEAHIRARAQVDPAKRMATVIIEPPHAEMHISPTHVYQFIEDDGLCTETWPPATKSYNLKQFVLNQDLLRISLPAFPETRAEPGKLRIFTELNETGEEMSVEYRLAEGVLPVTTITVPNLEGLEPVLQYCYRPCVRHVLALLLGEHLVDFGETYDMVSFRNTEKMVEQSLLLELKSLRVSRRISLSQPIPDDRFDQLLLSRIRFVDAVAKAAEGFQVGCPGFRNVLITARQVLFNAAIYRYQEAHKDDYPNRSELEAFTGTTADDF